jgi:hypothetical protein
VSEDFLSRWSRRKRDAGETEQAKSAPDERDSVPEHAVPSTATTVEPGEAIEPDQSPVFDLESLPPIDSITVATDIRPFLAPGVPGDLARAALRRAWSTDPRIRDFVGLADYDWDYNTPGSAAGFGPLEMTDELRRIVARILGDIVDGDAPDRGRQQATGTECVDESRALEGEAKGLSPGDREQPLAPPLDAPRPPGEPTVAEAGALQHGIPTDRGFWSRPKRGHGRALPR